MQESHNPPLGLPIPVRVSFLDSEGFLWLQLPSLDQQFSQLYADLQQVLTAQAPQLPRVLENQLVLAKHSDGLWHRAQVLSYNRVRLIDYGDDITVGLDSIRALPPRFKWVQAFALKCWLKGCVNLSREALNNYVTKFAPDQAVFYAPQDNLYPIELSCSRPVSMNAMLSSALTAPHPQVVPPAPVVAPQLLGVIQQQQQHPETVADALNLWPQRIKPVARTEQQTLSPQLPPLQLEPKPQPKVDLSPKETKSLSIASADFALNLLRASAEPGKNTFLSPLSISLCLAMVYAGADGLTAKEMRSVLFDGVNESEIHDSMSKIVDLLMEPKTGYQLYTANRIYGHIGFPIKKEFASILMRDYKSEMQCVDFSKMEGRERARLQINQWVEEVTKSRIKDLVPQSALTVLTRLVLVNAIYFKGDWKQKFKERFTRQTTFYSTPGRNTKVQMMLQTDRFLYAEYDELQVLGMPYVAGNLCMFVLLPKVRYGLDNLEKNLTGDSLMQLVQNAMLQKVNVHFPKFKLEQSFLLKEALQKLGMTQMFSYWEANFSKLTPESDEFAVSEVIHKAFVEVTEEGTEAAAATATVMGYGGGSMRLPPPPEFIADHSFLFLILDSNTQSLLFAGRFTNI